MAENTENGSSLITIKTPMEELARIESIATECRLVMSGATGNFQRALITARGIKLLRDALTPEIMAGIMALQGSKLGFRTDKDKEGGYPVDVVKDCAIEQVLRGGLLVGNEMNIIAGNAYQTKEFFTRMLAELPGFTDLKLFPGVPASGGEGRAIVAYVATWNYGGKPGRIDKLQTKLEDGTILDERLSIVVNRGMGPDAVLGKAERKIKAAIYARLTGTIITDADIDDAGSAPRQVANLSDLTQRLEEKTDANGLKPGETMKTDGEVVKEEPKSEPAADIGPVIADLKKELAAATDLSAVNKAEEFYLPKVPKDKEIEVTGRCDERREVIRAGRGSRANQQKELVGAK